MREQVRAKETNKMSLSYIPNGNTYTANVTGLGFFTANISSSSPTNQWAVTVLESYPVALKLSSDLTLSAISPIAAPGASGETDAVLLVQNQPTVISLNQTEGAKFVSTVRLVAIAAGPSCLVTVTPIVPRGF